MDRCNTDTTISKYFQNTICLKQNNTYINNKDLNYKIICSYEHACLFYAEDYVIFSNIPKENESWLYFAPKLLKPLLENNWIYFIHDNRIRNISRSVLQQRVNGGQLIAYQYSDYILELNNQPIKYIGLLNAIPNNDLNDHSHKENMTPNEKKIWLKEIIIKLIYKHDCDEHKLNNNNESDNTRCRVWNIDIRGRDKIINTQMCQKKINFSNLYVFTGGYVKCTFDEEESIQKYKKVPRNCKTCAQCIKCKKCISYCRRHRTCKHKTKLFNSIDDNNSTSSTFNNTAEIKIKKCKKI